MNTLSHNRCQAPVLAVIEDKTEALLRELEQRGREATRALDRWPRYAVRRRAAESSVAPF